MHARSFPIGFCGWDGEGKEKREGVGRERKGESEGGEQTVPSSLPYAVVYPFCEDLFVKKLVNIQGYCIRKHIQEIFHSLVFGKAIL